MIVRFHLEDDRLAVTDVDGSGVFFADLDGDAFGLGREDGVTC